MPFLSWKDAISMIEVAETEQWPDADTPNNTSSEVQLGTISLLCACNLIVEAWKVFVSVLVGCNNFVRVLSCLYLCTV